MRSKTLKKQLVIAIAMCLISAFALGTATYAWYVNNSKVAAEGMSINVMTDGTSFEISLPDEDTGVAPTDEKWPVGQTTVSFELNAIPVYPTHPEINSTYTPSSPAKWYHAFSEDYDDADVNADQDEIEVSANNNALETASGNKYALVATYYVRLNPVSSGDNASISNLKAGRIVMSYPEDATDLMKSARLLVAGPDGAEVLNNGDTIGTTTILNQITSNGNPSKIDVYMFFEGTDENCKSSLYDTSSISVSLEFIGEFATNS